MNRIRPLRQAADQMRVGLPDPPRHRDGQIDLDLLHAQFPDAILLEDATRRGYSYIIPASPVHISADAFKTTLHIDGDTQTFGADPFDALDEILALLGIDINAASPGEHEPFCGGMVGAFAYELGQFVEPIHAATPTGALMRLRLAETVLAVDAARETCEVIFHPHCFNQTAALARLALLQATRTPMPDVTDRDVASITSLTSNLTAAQYYHIVNRIKGHIADGSVFQVNIAQQFAANINTDLARLYRALRTHSAAPYGAVIPECGLAAVSPETFLSVNGRTVETRPIKGTRRRHVSAAVDAALADDLATSVKDRAENVMVVDMQRNDLGRVCVPGSVTVPALTQVVAHPTVWHLESRVAGTLRNDVTYGALLQATFPCGSITGAPKRAAMQYIAAYEPDPRGFYCGAYGYLGSGQAQLAVAIRSAQYDGTTARFGAGGGVVADSTATGEYLESLEKAELFRRAVNGRFPAPPE
ncbi:MAG: anthranilate synthase component I family protein [Nitriliruptoraceae bacterium]